MRRYRLWMNLGWLVVLCLALGACTSNRFVGSWKPVPSGDNDAMRIDSFNINKDGTFSIKFKDTSRKEIKGSYTISGDKLQFSVPDSKQKVEGTIESDGRLSVSEGGRKPAYFRQELVTTSRFSLH